MSVHVDSAGRYSIGALGATKEAGWRSPRVTAKTGRAGTDGLAIAVRDAASRGSASRHCAPSQAFSDGPGYRLNDDALTCGFVRRSRWGT
jgi:hypothetical protein